MPFDANGTTSWGSLMDVKETIDVATSICEDISIQSSIMTVECGISAFATTSSNGLTSLSPHSFAVVVVLAVVFGVIIFSTVFGNLLVIVAFFTTSKLRSYNNYFILGLAIADMLVGAVDMPLFALIIMKGRWPFGAVFCDIFSFLDHAFSHASILLVTLISLDRCIAVTKPLRHRLYWRRRSRAILIIAISYIVPVVIWLPTTALWQTIHGIVDRPIPAEVCEPLYMHHKIGSVTLPFAFLIIPFSITAILCLRIYIAIKGFYENRKKMNATAGNRDDTNLALPETTTTRSQPSDVERAGQGKPISISETIGAGSDLYAEYDEQKQESSKEEISRKERMRNKIGKESLKGVRTLVFIVAAMGIAWFPGAFTIVVTPICSTCLPGEFFPFAVFWGYTNSLLNPICYAMADKAFKEAFIQIITPGCLKRNKDPSLG